MHELNGQIRQNIANFNRQIWTQTVESCSLECIFSRLWRVLIKSLNGKRVETTPNQPNTFSSKSLTRKVKIATAFAKQFTTTVRYSSDLYGRIIRRKLHKECSLDNSVSHFSPAIVTGIMVKKELNVYIADKGIIYDTDVLFEIFIKKKVAPRENPSMTHDDVIKMGGIYIEHFQLFTQWINWDKIWLSDVKSKHKLFCWWTFINVSHNFLNKLISYKIENIFSPKLYISVTKKPI